MKRIFASAVMVLLSVHAALAVEAPVFYSRSNLIIMRAALPPAPPPLPWAQDVPPENPGVIFDVEVRDATTLYHQKGWYNLSSPDEKTGVLMAFPGPVIEPIVRSSQYAPLDILMIDHEGNIIQIMPSISLASLEQEINPPSPIVAFLFLRGGTCQHLSINPGDIVLYKLFRRPPTILTAPPPAQPPQQAQPRPVPLPPATPQSQQQPTFGTQLPTKHSQLQDSPIP